MKKNGMKKTLRSALLLTLTFALACAFSGVAFAEGETVQTASNGLGLIAAALSTEPTDGGVSTLMQPEAIPILMN